MDNNNCNCCQNSNNCGIHSGFQIQTVGGNQYNTIGTSTGDSRKIRIGNDINLDVTIQELNGMDVINIKAIKCFIINENPLLIDQRGTAYEIRRCGLPTYHCLPSHCNGHCTWKEHRCYDGFGMYPCMHKNWHCDLYPHYDYFYRNPYGRYQLKCVNPGHKPFEFIAPVKALEQRNKVRVYFPAIAQALCGMYSLTFVIDLYEPGYHCNNLRTITVDYNNVFELVPNMEGASGNIIIDIDKQVGLNVISNGLWGNAPQEENNNASTLTSIEGPNNICVGTFANYRALTNIPSNQLKWQVQGNNIPEIAETPNGGVALFGKTINNVVNGFEDIMLYVEATNGSGLTASKPIRIHNYAVDVDFGAYGSEDGVIYLTIPYGASISAPLYVTQEDGTKLSICERGCNCQAIEAVLAQIDPEHSQGVKIGFGVKEHVEECSWSYDEAHNNYGTNDASDEGISQECCKDNILTITNINKDEDPVESWVIITSQMKDCNGMYISKIIKINCIGSSGEARPQDDENEEDIYINSGVYNANTDTLTLSYTGNRSPLNIQMSDLGTISDTQDYWYI